MNIVELIGNLTRDPEVAYGQSGKARCTFTLAINRPKVNGQDAGADYIRIVAWSKLAETCGRYLHKGTKCAVTGTIHTGSYDKNGQKVYTTDVWANNVEFLTPRENSGYNGANQQNNTNYQPSNYQPPQGNYQPNNGQVTWDVPDSFAAAEDDIPF